MKVRFFNPHPSTFVRPSRLPAPLCEATQALNGRMLELADAVKLIQSALPEATVSTFGGFISVGIGKQAPPAECALASETWMLIRFEGTATP